MYLAVVMFLLYTHRQCCRVEKAAAAAACILGGRREKIDINKKLMREL